MKKIAAFLLLLLSVTNSYAMAFDQIVFFGDSLSDNGNLYKLFYKILPKSPPYYNGRFSNGPTWAEDVGTYYNENNKVRYKIYALGGATAAFHEPDGKSFAPITLSGEVDRYMKESSKSKDRSKVLATIWIGGNDYLYNEGLSDDAAVNTVVNTITNNISTLINGGVSHFLVLNLPDMSKLPFVRQEGETTRIQRQVALHNQKLADAIKTLQANNSDVHITFVDIYSVFTEAIDNTEQFNEKYATEYVNTKDACWQGGYTLHNPYSKQDLANDTQHAVNSVSKPNAASSAAEESSVDADTINNTVSRSPDLATAYNTNKLYEEGVTPCATPDKWLFWDPMHPTGKTHSVVAGIVEKALAADMG